MALFVIDASASLPWCFEDEATPWTEALLDRLRRDSQAVAPAHWITEVSNGLCMAVRRQRIASGQPELLVELLASLPIRVEPALLVTQAKEVLEIAMRLGLTVYDAAYLELAKRRGMPLATLDRRLRVAAVSEGVKIFEP